MSTALDSLSRAPRLALDTEANSFHRYYEKVCLLQLSLADHDVLFDPLAHGMPDRLRAVLSAEDRLIVLHGADYDVLSLRRDFDLVLGRIFDTMVAARFLGFRALGLQALLRDELGVTIQKDEQRSDWGRRPLSPQQIEYARQDTMHLLELADRLIVKLAEKGRLEWVEEECAVLKQRTPVVRAFDPEGWLKLAGAKSLPEVGRRALRAAYLWREDEAERTDRAPFRVANNEQLVALAAQVAKQGVKALDKFRHGGAGRRGALDRDALARAIERALDGADELPRAAARGAGRAQGGERPLDSAGRVRVQKMKAARDAIAARLELDPTLLAPAAILESLARYPLRDIEHATSRVPGMTRWRGALLFPAFLDALK